jgi:hypothetical protein
MAESFECPKCGAPMQYNSQEQGYRETMPCPYCGESVIIPADLRKQPAPQANNIGSFSQVDMSNLIDLERETLPVYNVPYQAPAAAVTRAAGWSIGGCVVASLITAAILGIIIFVAVISMGVGFLQFFNPGSNAANAIAPTQETRFALLPTEAPTIAAPTAAYTSTPQIDATATAQAQNEATRTAQNILANQQHNWPVVIQEKFNNDNLHWSTGLDNNEFAIEDKNISGNKYTWKFTSKKSMGSFDYPDMPVLTDMYVSVDMQMTSPNQNTDDQAGIIFRYNIKAQSFYFFSVNPNGSYSLSQYDGSNWNDLIPSRETDKLNPKQVNHLAISIQDRQILLMINNAVVDSFENPQLPSGTAGLGLNLTAPGEDATVVFTNFYVRAPKK